MSFTAALIFFFLVRPGSTTARTYREFLLFADEFDGPGLDPRRWTHDVSLGGGGNREFQAYATRPENAYTRNGTLYLEPTLTSDALGLDAMVSGTMDVRDEGCVSPNEWDCVRRATPENVLPPVFSAKLRSAVAFAFGRVEVRAKLPSGLWTWPGIWMMPADESVYGPWPSSGEIDLMESRGNPPSYRGPSGERLGDDVFGACFHWGPAWNHNGFPLTVNASRPLANGETLHDAFFAYGLYWSDRELFTYFETPANVVTRVPFYGQTSFYDAGLEAGLWDDAVPDACAGKGSSKLAPFDRAFRVILNVAVGGTSKGIPGTDTASGYWPDDLGDKPWANGEAYPHTAFFDARDDWAPSWRDRAAAMQIDSVKVWGFEGLTNTWSSSSSSTAPHPHGHPAADNGRRWIVVPPSGALLLALAAALLCSLMALLLCRSSSRGSKIGTHTKRWLVAKQRRPARETSEDELPLSYGTTDTSELRN